jgi:MarR family transcriptional regulator, organic hydroperoxide resistance regulator
MNQDALQNKCATRLQTLLPWLRYYLRDLLKEAPEGTLRLHDIRVLARVSRFPGLSLQGLADDLGINKATASCRVEQLVSLGLLERTVNPRSRREIMLTISAQGLVEYQKAKDFLKSHLVTQMNQFSSEELLSLEKGLSLLARIVIQAHPEISKQLSEL